MFFGFKKRLLLAGSCVLLVNTVASVALADDAQAAWGDTIKFSGHAEVGITFNPNQAAGVDNVGELFSDKANQVLLNQVMGTVTHPIDSQANAWDAGFTIQAIFGSDARYTHSLTELDHLIHDRNQLDFTEVSLSVHMPVLADLLDHGIDLKIGDFPSPMGAEVIDATGNYLYSHSYIFNFGVPLKQTGMLSTIHATPFLDLYGGLDTGVNAFLGKNGFNNGIVHGQVGFGLNLLDGNLTVLGFSHIGAENPPNAVGLPRSALRYLNDITTTWKMSDTWTFINDANYIQDDGLRAIGYGDAVYGLYAINDHLTLVGRGEVWRDNAGAFVASFPGYFDFVNFERGLPATAIGGGRTTYGEATLGLNIKPDVPKSLEGLVIRPELRVDHALNGTKPYNQGKDTTSVTPAVDVVVPF